MYKYLCHAQGLQNRHFYNKEFSHMTRHLALDHAQREQCQNTEFTSGPYTP